MADAAADPVSNEAPKPRRRGQWVVVLIIAAWVGLMISSRPPRIEPLFCERDVAPTADTLVMLSASWCGYCRRARAFLHDQGIAHCEYDVETSTEGSRQFNALRVKVVPVIKIRDDVLFGFNETAIRDSLIAHGLAEFPD